MPTTISTQTSPLVLVGSQNGITVIPAETPLARLNYFDGKFLRATDLNTEQRYLRSLVEFSNRAGGPGIAFGFEVTPGGQGQLEISPGLAIDPEGRVLLLTAPVAVGLQELIDRSRQVFSPTPAPAAAKRAEFGDCVATSDSPGATTFDSSDLYVITAAHAEALCGKEDVYGKLCEEACITSTDRPFRLEGVILRARPLQLNQALLPQSTAEQLTRKHLRSRVASAFYAAEALTIDSLINQAGLKSDVWCAGASGAEGTEVPLAVVARAGSSILFVDLWIVRRERLDPPAKRYWQWRMRMRPWDVFLAQVLQFQCQLHRCADTPPPEGGDDPCHVAQKLVEEAVTHFATLTGHYTDLTAKIAKSSRKMRETLEVQPQVAMSGLNQLEEFRARLVHASQVFKLLPGNRVLIGCGIIETPSAGYLPVEPSSTLSVNQQVRRLLGEGVNLRFCLCRPDYVAHAWEEAQHLDRISLIKGLDHPAQKPDVDVLVPDGQIAPNRVEQGRFYEMRLNLPLANWQILVRAARDAILQQAQAADELGDAPKKYEAGAYVRSQPYGARFSKLYLAALAREGEYEDPQTLKFTGAARSEDRGTDGVAFYYAGVSEGFVIEKAKPQSQPVPSPATAPTEAASHGVLNGPGIRADVAFGDLSTSLPPARGLVDQILAKRYFNVGSEFLARETQPSARGSLWASLELERNPAALARGESTPARAEYQLLLTASGKLRPRDDADADPTGTTLTRQVLIRALFTGDLQVDDQDRRPGSDPVQRTKAVLTGELAVTVRQDGEQQSFNLYLSESVDVLERPSPDGPAFLIQMSEPSVLQPMVAGLQVERKWTSPLEANAFATIAFRSPKSRAETADDLPTATKTTQREAFQAWQKINAAVYEPNHPAHEAAIRGLRNLEAALGKSRFAQLAAARLFPPAQPLRGDLTILPTLPWVLFHRRRERVCQLDKPAPPIETRQYALYHVQLSPRQTVDELQKVLAKGTVEALRAFTFDFVQLVDFGAGIHAVTSPHRQVQAAWNQDVGTDAGPILGGAIASRGVALAEGKPLAEDRIESLVGVLRAAYPVAAAPDFAVLPRVPENVDTGQNDGIVVLATQPTVVTNCHAVYGVEHLQNLDEFRSHAAETNDLIATIRKHKNLPLLGTVNFAGLVPNPSDLESVKRVWDGLGYGAAAGVLVVSAHRAALEATYQRQGANLLPALGGSGVPQSAATTEALTGLTDCPAVTFVAGSVRYRTALMVYSSLDQGQAGVQHFLVRPTNPGNYSPLVDFRDDVPRGNEIAIFIRGLRQANPNLAIVGVTLATLRDRNLDGEEARLRAVLAALAAEGFSVTQPKSEALTAADDAELRQEPEYLSRVGVLDGVIFFEMNTLA